jgi:DNA-binding protein HU-beta
MKTITKADLLKRVAEATGVTKVETEAIIDGFMKSIIETLQEGNRIEMRGFGVFLARKRRPRMARNPRTGESVPMGEHYVPVFKPSREMRNHVNNIQAQPKATTGTAEQTNGSTETTA